LASIVTTPKSKYLKSQRPVSSAGSEERPGFVLGFGRAARVPSDRGALVSTVIVLAPPTIEANDPAPSGDPTSSLAAKKSQALHVSLRGRGASSL
jgi:hypothetical protein